MPLSLLSVFYLFVTLSYCLGNSASFLPLGQPPIAVPVFVHPSDSCAQRPSAAIVHTIDDIVDSDDDVATVIEDPYDDEDIKADEKNYFSHRCGETNELKDYKPKTLTTKRLEQWCETLPKPIRDSLDDPTGKHSSLIDWEGQLELRHVVPCLLRSGMIDEQSFQVFESVCPFVCIYARLVRQFATVDTSPLQNFGMYENFKQETDFCPNRIRLATAALLHADFDAAVLTRYIGGTHVGAHRDLAAIRQKLTPSVEPKLLDDTMHLYEFGAPVACNGYSSKENFWTYYRKGNHKSCALHQAKFRKVMVKDSKRGNVLLFDQAILWFVRNLHLTPQAMVDIDNKWKNDRPVYDSSCRPEVWSECINDWINKITEGDLFFPGSFLRFLVWLWNMRISYPKEAIFLCDDDVKNAFRLIKLNPEIVSMHGFVGCGLLALNTGMTFGNTNSGYNFDKPATARSQHAKWLWLHEADESLRKCEERLKDMRTEAFDDNIDFAPANGDAHNAGVFNTDGTRMPPAFTGHVDDHIYADVIAELRKAVACSLVSADDAFGGSHATQEDIISDEKFNSLYREIRLILGHLINTRTMMVQISPRRREKTIDHIEEEGWATTRTVATIREVARILGLLQSLCDIFIWGQAKLLVLQQLMGEAIRNAYKRAQHDRRIHQFFVDESRKIPNNLAFRLKYLKLRIQCKFLWQSRRPIAISAKVRSSIKVIYDYLKSDQPWQCPIGHLVPRAVATESKGDASHCAIGVINSDLRYIILLPFKKELFDRMKSGKTHINSMELIALFLGYISFLAKYNLTPEQFPPHPYIKLWGDSMSANKWFRKFSTNSVMATSALLLFAEYMKHSPVSPIPEWIAGDENTEADDISRVQELFSPKKTHIYDVPFPILLNQVCLKYKQIRDWEIFLPSQEILADLSYVVYTDFSTEVPKTRKNLGHFVRVDSISCGSANSTTYSNSFFL